MFGLFEMGSNSLKHYLVGAGGEVSTIKVPWRVAHELFETGALSEAGIDGIVAAVLQARAAAAAGPRRGELCVATGVFRELANLDAVVARVLDGTGVRVRVIGGADEAALMARGFRELEVEEPAVLCDLGGASLEWAWRPGAARPPGPTSGSLRLGAIRNHYAFAGRPDYRAASEAACDAELAALPVVAPTRLVVTGGTAAALAELAGAECIPRAELDAWLDRVARDGPPAALKPSRREVLLPGLIILARLARRCDAAELRYGTAAVREGMALRLVQLLQRFPPDALRATQLLRRTRGDKL